MKTHGLYVEKEGQEIYYLKLIIFLNGYFKQIFHLLLIRMSDRLSQVNQNLTFKLETRAHELRLASNLCSKNLFDSIFPPSFSQYFDQVYKMIEENQHIFSHEDQSRLDERKRGFKQTMTVMKTLQIDLQKNPAQFEASLYALSYFGLGTTIKGLVQFILYAKTLLLFESNSYHRECLARANRLEDLGSFSLTQLHHGSFSKGIVTEAHYDHKGNQFRITTHGEKGMKFWIGNVAELAEMTILWALLIVNGKNEGPHPFVIRLRDKQTHEVLPGITVGDCGPKNGINIVDNGYIILDIRVPYDTLLGKIGWINTATGKYQSKVAQFQKRFGLHMSPLSVGRALLTLNCLSQSTLALTIALRYTAQRRQFKTQKMDSQMLLLDFPTTRFRLLIPLAQNFIYYFGGVKINLLYSQNKQHFSDPSKSIISQLHAISAVLKVKSSTFSSSVITECREMLGGHGYSSFSRLGRIYQDNDVSLTFEGDNNLLLQQTTKYLIKSIRQKKIGETLDLSFISETLQELDDFNKQYFKSIGNLRKVLKIHFSHLYRQLVKEVQKLKNTENFWDEIYPYFGNQLSMFYGDLFCFEEAVKGINLMNHETNKKFMESCLKLWAYQLLLKCKIGSHILRRGIEEMIIELCEVIYPDCMKAIDTLAPPQFVIGSPFAKEDGEGMKDYVNMVFTGKGTFQRVSWFQELIKMRQQ